MGSERRETAASLADRLRGADSPTTAARTAVETFVRRPEVDAAVVFTVEDGSFRPLAAQTDGLVAAERYRDAEEGIVGRVRETGEAALVEDIGSDPDAAPTASYGAIAAASTGDGVLATFGATGALDAGTLAAVETGAAQLAESLDRLALVAAADREQDRVRALFENVPDPAFEYVTTESGIEIEAVNTAFVQSFGFAPAEATGRTVGSLLVPDGEPNVERDARSVADREVTRHTTDGRTPFLLRRVPVDEAGRGYCIYADISALKRRERDLERQNERLDRFAGIVSHDLRNPLTVAEGYLDVAREEHDAESLAKVADAHDRIEAIIDDALSLARGGAAVVDPTRVAVADVAADAWDSVDTDGATVAIDTGRVVEADPARLQRLFENLFRNAVEHGSTSPPSQAQADAVEHSSTSPRSGTREDAVEHEDDAGSVTVRVHDTPDGIAVADDGPGIPPGEREGVFEPGYTTDHAGTGFGLAIVREIANAHGWSASVEESDDGGARFVITIDAA